MARLPGSWETPQPCLQLLGQPGTRIGTRKWVSSSASQWLRSACEWPRLPVPLLIWEIHVTAEPLWGPSGWGPGLGARPVPQFCESSEPASPPSRTYQERNPVLPSRQVSNQQTTLCFCGPWCGCSAHRGLGGADAGPWAVTECAGPWVRRRDHLSRAQLAPLPLPPGQGIPPCFPTLYVMTLSSTGPPG